MYKREKKIYFVGVAGVGMAGIAEILARMGYQVSGSDSGGGARAEYLKQLGIEIFDTHSEANISPQTGVLVYSSAISPENPEIQAAQKLGIPVIRRAEMLAELMRMKHGIAVAGSHGKTSITSLVAHLLVEGELDPSVIIGGRLIHRRSGAKLGQSQYMVAEADESDGSFSLLKPTLAVISNIDKEHIEHYGSLDTLEESFCNFANSVPFYGAIFACFDCARTRKVAEKINRRLVSYGLVEDSEPLDYAAEIIEQKVGFSSYYLHRKGEKGPKVSLPLSGRHQVLNSLAAIAIAEELDIPEKKLLDALASFPGIARRSELLLQTEAIALYDDYGHHPTEIKATLAGLSNETGRLIVIFQPHRFSRTKSLVEEFRSCFADADQVLFTEIFSAGENDSGEISSSTLIEQINENDPGKAVLVGDFNGAISWCDKSLAPGDTLVTMGAGSIGGFAPRLRTHLEDSFSP